MAPSRVATADLGGLASGTFDGLASNDAVYAYEAESLSTIETTSSRSASRNEPAPPPMPPVAFAGNDEPAIPPAPSDPDPPAQEPATEMARLLIYTAQLNLAIHQVTEVQEQAIALVEEAGGYAAYRDGYSVILRVPAGAFHSTLDALKGLGDVLAVQWQAEEVSDQFRDLEIRLRTAIEMRDRLAQLLAQAQTVADALAIEEQLQRLTLEIELYEGQLRSLSDRISFSTITVTFSELASSNVPTNEYRLPFYWLNSMGLERLLTL
jgi:hypothetical protein